MSRVTLSDSIDTVSAVMKHLMENQHIHPFDTKDEYDTRIPAGKMPHDGYKCEFRNIRIGDRYFHYICARAHELIHKSESHPWTIETTFLMYELSPQMKWRVWEGWIYTRPNEGGEYRLHDERLWVQFLYKGKLHRYGPPGWIGKPDNGQWQSSILTLPGSQ